MKLLYILSAMLLNMGTASALPFSDAENQAHDLKTSQAWVRQTGNRKISAAIYLNIRNTGSEADLLLDIKSDMAERSQIHRSVEEDGIMRMRHIKNLEIGSGEIIAFEPGGYHIMLTRLSQPLKEGDHFPVTLSFKHAGDITVDVLVTGITGLQE